MIYGQRHPPLGNRCSWLQAGSGERRDARDAGGQPAAPGRAAPAARWRVGIAVTGCGPHPCLAVRWPARCLTRALSSHRGLVCGSPSQAGGGRKSREDTTGLAGTAASGRRVGPFFLLSSILFPLATGSAGFRPVRRAPHSSFLSPFPVYLPLWRRHPRVRLPVGSWSPRAAAGCLLLSCSPLYPTKG